MTIPWLAATLQAQVLELEELLELVPCEEPDTLQVLAFARCITFGDTLGIRSMLITAMIKATAKLSLFTATSGGFTSVRLSGSHPRPRRYKHESATNVAVVGQFGKLHPHTTTDLT
jgi:predicted RNA binding protein YcfA (HicA-like mRNA interferase family)